MKPIRLSVTNRHATWLELFFDLVFVASIGVISHTLAHTHEGHLGFDQLINFVLEFFPLWWIWASHTLYSNRLDKYSRIQRICTLSIIFLLINLSARFGGNVLANTNAFILIYTAIRLIIAFLYFWSRFTERYTRKYSRYMLISTLIGAVVSFSALFMGTEFRIPVFYLGILLEMVMVAFVSKEIHLLPVHRSHLVERIGLMTMILLGESIISLVGSLQSDKGDDPNLIAMMSGFIMIGAIWWIYYGTFFLLEGAKRVQRGITLLYTHLIFSMGLVILANLIGLTMTDSIDSSSFRMLTFFGLIFFYIGKQVTYLRAYPVYRTAAVVISLISITVAGVATMLPTPTFALVGVTTAMLVYSCVNYVWTLSIDPSNFLENGRE